MWWQQATREEVWRRMKAQAPGPPLYAWETTVQAGKMQRPGLANKRLNKSVRSLSQKEGHDG